MNGWRADQYTLADICNFAIANGMQFGFAELVNAARHAGHPALDRADQRSAGGEADVRRGADGAAAAAGGRQTARRGHVPFVPKGTCPSVPRRPRDGRPRPKLTPLQPLPPSPSATTRTGARGESARSSGRTARRSTRWRAIAGRWRSSAATSPAMSHGVNERISANLKMLDGLEEVTTRLLADQARVADSTDEARRARRTGARPSSIRAAARSRTRSGSSPASPNSSSSWATAWPASPRR